MAHKLHLNKALLKHTEIMLTDSRGKFFLVERTKISH